MDNDHSNKIELNPIGIIHSAFNQQTGAPRQGCLLPDSQGTIEIYPEYIDALKDLERFEYITILFYFDRIENWNSVVSPPAAEHQHHFGLFATRSPKRPNPIGYTTVKLEKIEDGKLTISGIDAFDQTPLLDIKPYLPSIDSVKSTQNEFVEKKLGHHDEVFISDPSFFK